MSNIVRAFLPRPRNPELRFMSKLTFEPNSGCWIWLGEWQASGYGHFKAFGEVTAHRASYRMHVGPIPLGLQVLHKCDVRQCVNPDHLFVGTQRDNMRDMACKGRAQRYNASKTHCPAGHEYTAGNTRNVPGGRACRACERVRALARRNANIEIYRERDRAAYWKKKESVNG